ncbi:hypothetical protein [Novibacillus thermophilus]|jgi:hypothetical protein|nr:hypothetical protein [Novibacillus thermophilus]
MESRGIKCHKALQPPSCYHHHSWIMAYRSMKAGTEASSCSNDELVEQLQMLWDSGGKDLFREGEALLFSAYAKYASPDQPEIVENLLEHALIRSKVQQLLTQLSISEALMHERGSLLEGRIQKEERVLFPVFKRALPEEELEKLSLAFTEMTQHR